MIGRSGFREDDTREEDQVPGQVNDVRDERFTVNLIPHTLGHTNLDRLHPGATVNIEIDLLARYGCAVATTRAVGRRPTGTKQGFRPRRPSQCRR